MFTFNPRIETEIKSIRGLVPKNYPSKKTKIQPFATPRPCWLRNFHRLQLFLPLVLFFLFILFIYFMYYRVKNHIRIHKNENVGENDDIPKYDILSAFGSLNFRVNLSWWKFQGWEGLTKALDSCITFILIKLRNTTCYFSKHNDRRYIWYW